VLLRDQDQRPANTATVRNVALIGYGAIGQAIATALRGDKQLRITHVLVRAERVDEMAGKLPDGVRPIDSLAKLTSKPDLLLEVASHAAVAAFVPEALAAGIDTAIVSTGALADERLRERLADSARRGGAQLHLLSGAIGAIDALAAYREGALTDVVYVGRKPPQASTARASGSWLIRPRPAMSTASRRRPTPVHSRSS
jgi:aspartate dehydrogenase